MEKLESVSTVTEKENGAAAVENSTEVPQNFKQRINMLFSYQVVSDSAASSAVARQALILH